MLTFCHKKLTTPINELPALRWLNGSVLNSVMKSSYSTTFIPLLIKMYDKFNTEYTLFTNVCSVGCPERVEIIPPNEVTTGSKFRYNFIGNSPSLVQWTVSYKGVDHLHNNLVELTLPSYVTEGEFNLTARAYTTPCDVLSPTFSAKIIGTLVWYHHVVCIYHSSPCYRLPYTPLIMSRFKHVNARALPVVFAR